MSPIKHILVVVDPMGGERQSAVDKTMIFGAEPATQLLQNTAGSRYCRRHRQTG